MICRMQVHIVKQMPSVKAGYVDPQSIAQTNFNYPRQWKLDAKELVIGKTLREKEDIRAKKLRQESLKVSYILPWLLKISNNTLLYGYHTTSSKFNSILKALFDIFYSMQKSLSSSMIKSMQQPLDLYRRGCREEHSMGL